MAAGTPRLEQEADPASSLNGDRLQGRDPSLSGRVPLGVLRLGGDPGGCRAGTGPPAHAGLGGARGSAADKGAGAPSGSRRLSRLPGAGAGLLTGGRCRPLPAPGRRASGGRGGAAEQSRALGAERRPPARTPSPAGWLRAPRTWRRRWVGTLYLSTGPTASARTGESSSSSKGAPREGVRGWRVAPLPPLPARLPPARAAARSL